MGAIRAERSCGPGRALLEMALVIDLHRLYKSAVMIQGNTVASIAVMGEVHSVDFVQWYPRRTATQMHERRRREKEREERAHDQL